MRARNSMYTPSEVKASSARWIQIN
jgi:hypothetical protein